MPPSGYVHLSDQSLRRAAAAAALLASLAGPHPRLHDHGRHAGAGRRVRPHIPRGLVPGGAAHLVAGSDSAGDRLHVDVRDVRGRARQCRSLALRSRRSRDRALRARPNGAPRRLCRGIRRRPAEVLSLRPAGIGAQRDAHAAPARCPDCGRRPACLRRLLPQRHPGRARRGSVRRVFRRRLQRARSSVRDRRARRIRGRIGLGDPRRPDGGVPHDRGRAGAPVSGGNRAPRLEHARDPVPARGIAADRPLLFCGPERRLSRDFSALGPAGLDAAPPLHRRAWTRGFVAAHDRRGAPAPMGRGHPSHLRIRSPRDRGRGHGTGPAQHDVLGASRARLVVVVSVLATTVVLFAVQSPVGQQIARACFPASTGPVPRPRV